MNPIDINDYKVISSGLHTIATFILNLVTKLYAKSQLLKRDPLKVRIIDPMLKWGQVQMYSVIADGQYYVPLCDEMD